jgi:ATP-dependent DNA helicase RecQ
LWQQVGAARRQHPDLLGHDIALTRFLCGVSSPRLNRARLAAHPLFGQLAEVPFQQVLSWIKQQPAKSDD